MKGLHFYYEKRRSIAKMELQNGRPENIDNRLDKEKQHNLQKQTT